MFYQLKTTLLHCIHYSIVNMSSVRIQETEEELFIFASPIEYLDTIVVFIFCFLLEWMLCVHICRIRKQYCRWTTFILGFQELNIV